VKQQDCVKTFDHYKQYSQPSLNFVRLLTSGVYENVELPCSIVAMFIGKPIVWSKFV
jgi:hypothetical protein